MKQSTHTNGTQKKQPQRMPSGRRPVRRIRQRKANYAFIDSQNMYQGIRAQGWTLDWAKFRHHLTHQLGVTKALLFIGFVPGNEPLYDELKKAGFDLVFKPTVTIHKDGETTVKGNVDTDLVLHAMLELAHYDGAVIASGDGDFHSLAAYLQKSGKLKKLIVPGGRQSSTLLTRDFGPSIVPMNGLRGALQKKSAQPPQKNTSEKVSGRRKSD